MEQTLMEQAMGQAMMEQTMEQAMEQAGDAMEIKHALDIMYGEENAF